MKQLRRIIGLLLAVVMLCSMIPVAFADSTSRFADFPTGWSKEAMTAAVNNGLLNGYDDGNIHPEANLTRAQFAAIMVRAFGAKTKANISKYRDVSTDAWYYNDIARAVKMGALKGQSDTEMAPDSPITRQEAFTAFARILVLSDEDTSVLDKFHDKGEIASWAINHMAALTKRGYVNGDTDGNVNPRALISREEFAQMMHNAIRTYITEPGTYTDDLEGITVVRTGGVTLKKLKNTSDLVIGDGAGDGSINLENVTIGKRLLARGGNIKVSKSSLGDRVVVNNVNGVTVFQNYRDESFFNRIVENTTAKFLTYGSGYDVVIPSDTVYTLTLKVDGVPYDTITVTNGIPNKNISDITTPTKDYYTFEGWFDGADNEITDFGSVTATQDLNAKFTPNTYNVTFTGTPDFSWVDGYHYITSFTVEEFATKELPPADKVVAPVGYTFEYWTIKGTQIDSLEAIKNNGHLPATADSLTIEAHYAIKQYRVTYEGVTWNPGCEPTELEYNVTNVDTYTLPAATDVLAPSGMEFRYWKVVTPEGDVRIDALTITADTPDVITLKPYFVAVGTPDEIYTLTLKVDGEVYDTVVVTNGIPNKTVTDPVKNYYTFDGWYDSADNKVTHLGAVTATQDLNAKFTANTYTVTFTGTPNFVWVSGYTPISDFTIEEFTTKELPSADKVVAPLGYTFEYWTINGTQIDSLEAIKNNGHLPATADSLTIEAHITLKQYRVTYEGVNWNPGCEPTELEYNVTNVDTYTLPAATDVLAPSGMEFRYWKVVTSEGDVRIDALTITADTPDVITLKPHFVAVGTPDEIYTLTLKVDGEVYDTVVVTNGIPNKTVTDPVKNYYTFNGWYDSADNKITNFGTVTATQEIFAKFDAITYNVAFTGTPSFVWVSGYTPISDFTIEEFTTKELPSADKVVAPVGYTFEYWTISGTQIDSLEAIKDGGYLPATTTTTVTLEAQYALKQYRVTYEGVTWQTGCEPTELEYNLTTVDTYTLPTADDVVAPAGYEFKYWKDSAETRVDILTITDETPDVLTLTPHFELIPAQPVTVSFYRIYSDKPIFLIGSPLSIEKGTTVDKASFPNPEAYVRKGYVEDENVASVYAGNESTHLIAPEFWYIKDGVMTPFDETVIINEDTKVYLLSKALSLMLSYEYEGKVNALSVSADYNKDTRVMDSIKDIVAKSGRQQLELALATDMIPKYDETVEKAVDKMVKAGVIELDGNEKKIQIVKVPFKISTFVKEEVANGMIKKYLRDVVKNPAELDKIFSMINVAEFADRLGIDTIIANMTDAEIASLLKSSDNKEDIVGFIYSDLQKTDSKMMSFVIEYVTTDEFRGDIIDQLVAELKDKSKTSALKAKALEYIDAQLDNTGSAFYGKFVSMIKADLQSSSSVVMDAVVSYVRTNLKASTEEGVALRKEILTSSQLPNFLANEMMKAEVIKLILQNEFIDKALDNVDFRTVLVEAIMSDDDFIDLLLASTEFHDYIIDQLHPVAGDASAHPLAKDVEDLLQNKDSKFRKYVLDLVKVSSEFVGLFTAHPELEDVVASEIEWSDFVADDNDFLKFAFRQSGVAGTYTFVSLNDIDEKIAESYNALSDIEKTVLIGSTALWNGLSDSDKQTVRNKLYENQDAKDTVLAEAKAKFNSYKASIVTKVTTGKIDEITDATAIKLIDELLVDYVTKYIEQERLHADDAINTSIAEVIEEILYGFISDLIHGEDFDDALEAELAVMLGHIETVKHQFVIDPTPDVIARLKTIVKNYRDTHVPNINTIINNNYTALSNKLVSMIDPNAANSVYTEVESALISVADTVDASLIKGYIDSISDSDLEALIKKYMKNVTVADLNNYIAAFLYDSVTNTENAANVATVRTEIEAFIEDDDQAETVKDMAVTYITDPDNETDVKTTISSFIDDIDETFVNKNRTIITEALKSIDITEFVDEQFIKDYVAGLTETEKIAFADDIFAALQSDADYSKFMNQLLNGDSVEVNKSNISLVTAISGAIRGLSFDSVIGFIDNAAINKLKDTVGTDFIKKYYDEMLKEYCYGLDAVIEEVKLSSNESFKKSYTTSLTFRLDIFSIYEKLYEKAIDKVIDKVEKAGIYYNENIYLKFLVEHNILDYILSGNSSLANGEFTGYSLKGEMDYYDYVTMLLIVGDDALTWYGDEIDGLSEEQLDALYDASFDKVFLVHEKANEILIAFRDDGTLPAPVQNAIESVSQLNSLVLQYGDTAKTMINRYLDSNINIKFEDESIAQDEKIMKVVDLLIGNDNPVVNIDAVYAMLSTFNDKIQSKLAVAVESDKFKAAVNKFETSSFGEMFDGRGQLGTIGDKLDELRNNGRISSALDSLYDMFYILATEGIEAFKVPAEETAVTEIEIYKIKVGKVEMTVKRSYR